MFLCPAAYIVCTKPPTNVEVKEYLVYEYLFAITFEIIYYKEGVKL